MGERYAGEEDFAATSTALLARSGICNLWTAVDDGRGEEALQQITCLADQESPSTEEEEDEVDITLASYLSARSKKPEPTTQSLGYRFSYPRFPKKDEFAVDMWVTRIIWIASVEHHKLHLRRLTNQMRSSGIQVDEASGTEEMSQILRKTPEPAVNFVITSLFDTPNGDGVGLYSDLHAIAVAHDLLEEDNTLSFRIVCASMTAISSRERSTLYSKGAHMVAFNLHTLELEEVMEKLAFVQRYGNQLLNVIRLRSFEVQEICKHSKDRLTELVRHLLQTGVDVSHASRSWAPLHYAVELEDYDPKVLGILLEATGADVEVRSRYTFGNVPKGSTPLMVAVEHGNVDAVKQLLAKNASPHTPADLAENGKAVSKDLSIALTPLKLADWKANNEEETETGGRRYQQILKLLKSKAGGHSFTEIPKPPASRPVLNHPLLTVLWVSVSPKLSPHTYEARRNLEVEGSLCVRTMTVPEWVCQAFDGDAPRTAGHRENREGKAMEFVKSMFAAYTEDLDQVDDQGKCNEPLAWLQVAVFELLGVKNVELWDRCVKMLQAQVAQRRPEGAPWLKFITYAEGKGIKVYDSGEAVSDELYLYDRKKNILLLNNHVQVASQMPVQGAPVHPMMTIITADVDHLPKDGSQSSKDKNKKKHTTALGLHKVLQLACLHWAWDCEDKSKHFPDHPYNASVSARIERLYRAGAPSVRVTESRAVYFKDMVQRVIGICAVFS